MIQRGATLLVAVALGCGDGAPKAAPPIHVDLGQATRPRGPDEIDGFGVGGVEIGTSAGSLAHLGFTGEAPHGSVSFTQNGKPVPATVRFGGTLSLRRGEEVVIEAQIEPAHMSVDEIVVRGRGPATREGLGIGATVADLRAAYGAPASILERNQGTCYQFARRSTVHFCVGDGEHVRAIVIPARLASPLSLGEDVPKLAAALEGRVIGGAVYRGGTLTQIGGKHTSVRTTPIAPCLLSVPDPDQHVIGFTAFIARGGDVLQSDGGWRRSDGSMIICYRSDVSVFEVDPGGRAIRWSYVDQGNWRSEPAECRIEDSLVQCRGATEMTEGFRGTIVGDLVVPRELAGKLGSIRAHRVDGAPTDECGRLLERAWQESLAAFALLGVDQAKIAYLESEGPRDFAGRCEAAKASERACLVASPSILSPDPRCTLRPPYFDWKARLGRAPEPRRLPPAEAAKRARTLVGTWNQDLGHYGQRRWTFQRDGRLSIDGKPKGRYQTKRAGELFVDDHGNLTSYPLALLDKDHLHTDFGSIWCPQDLAHANIDLGGALLLVRGQICRALSPYGALSDAACARQDAELKVTYESRSEVLRIIDGCYVDSKVQPLSRVR